MSTENSYTIVGNLSTDPELRFTPAGAAVANFTVVSTPRVKQGDNWVDGEPLFMRCAVWRQAAENVAESLTKGTRVIVTGKLKQRTFEAREGGQRTVVEMDVDEIGATLKWATVRVAKAGRASEARQAPIDGDDPWSAPSDGKAADDEPPF